MHGMDLIWSDLIWSDLIWSDLIWSDPIWSDLIWSDLIWSYLIKHLILSCNFLIFFFFFLLSYSPSYPVSFSFSTLTLTLLLYLFFPILPYSSTPYFLYSFKFSIVLLSLTSLSSLFSSFTLPSPPLHHHSVSFLISDSSVLHFTHLSFYSDLTVQNILSLHLNYHGWKMNENKNNYENMCMHVNCSKTKIDEIIR